MKHVSLCALACAVVIGLTGCGAGNDPSVPDSSTSAATSASLGLVNAGELVIGTSLTVKPMEYTDAGQPAGFDIEIGKAIAKDLGLRPVFVNTNFATLITSLAAGKYDAVISSITINDNRRQVVDFSVPYIHVPVVLAANTSTAPNLKTVNDLKSGTTVGVVQGSSSGLWAQANLAKKGVVLRFFPSESAEIDALEGGTLQGALVDQISYTEASQGRSDLLNAGIVDTGTTSQDAVAVAKNHEALVTAINGSLSKIFANGTYRNLYNRFFPTIPIADATPSGATIGG
jgi:ABC-type amino acid transport substrate-binding protein